MSGEAETVARRLRDGMARGVLSFPLTSFHDDGSLDPEGFRAHVAAQISTGPGAATRRSRMSDAAPPAAPASSSRWTRTSTGRS